MLFRRSYPVMVHTFRCMRQSSTITAALVKELREKSGAGMMDCKKALQDSSVNGDIAKAMDWLRTKGIARATSQVSTIPFL